MVTLISNLLDFIFLLVTASAVTIVINLTFYGLIYIYLTISGKQ